MSRLGLIVRNPKMALGALATVGVAASLTVGSGAFVADQEASEGNTVQAGTAELTVFGSSAPTIDGNTCRDTGDDFVEPAGYVSRCLNGGIGAQKGATFKVTNLSPGQPEMQRCFVVGSESDVPVGVRLDIDSFKGNEDLAKALNVRIARVPQAGSQGSFTIPASEHTNIVNDTLWNLKGAAAKVADANKAGTLRRALEEDEAYKYCAFITLANPGQDQDEIEGQSVEFAINALGQSIYGSLQDGERADDAGV